MSHAARPLHIGRAFAAVAVQPAQADWPYYPTRESDGDEWHVGVMVDARQAHIAHARDTAAKFLRQAREARLSGNAKSWDWCMVRAASWRMEYARACS